MPTVEDHTVLTRLQSQIVGRDNFQTKLFFNDLVKIEEKASEMYLIISQKLTDNKIDWHFL